VAFAFLVVMALGTVPSPLYGLYRARDHFSLFMVTVAFAVYAVGVIVALLLAGHLSDLYGRRRLLLPAVCISIVSAVVFIAWKSLPGLLMARFVNGISIGIVASTATAYLADLHAIGRPRATARKAQLTASAVNVGGLAVGALVAGLLAQWVAHPLTVPYVVFLAALVLGAVGVAVLPETREAATPLPRYRPQRLSVPPAERGRYFAAALSTFVAFAANGLFAGLAGLFLAVTLHHRSLALAGGVVACMFGAAVAAQFLTVGWSLTRDLRAGMAAMVIGIGLAVLAVWLHSPSLGLFIAGGVMIGAGSGAIFKGGVGTVMSISPPERIAESLTGVFLAAYVGISLPVVGAGVTLARHVTPKVTILGFAIAVTVGIAAAAIKLLGRATTQASAAPTATAPATNTDGGTSRRDAIRK
jgi:predicted MFS family arabinose efflux permease